MSYALYISLFLGGGVCISVFCLFEIYRSVFCTISMEGFRSGAVRQCATYELFRMVFTWIMSGFWMVLIFQLSDFVECMF